MLVYCDDKQSTSNISSYKVQQTWPLEGCITMGNLAFLTESLNPPKATKKGRISPDVAVSHPPKKDGLR